MTFINQNTKLPKFMIFPKFLMENEKINDTAKIVYVILLDRARLSVKSPEWHDEKGNAFIIYPLENIAEMIKKGISAVQRSMDMLERENLIYRKSSGVGFANHIYVMFPDEVKKEEKDSAETRCSKTNNATIQKRTTPLPENEQRHYPKTNNGPVYSDRNNSKLYRNYYDTDEIESLCVNNISRCSKTNNATIQKRPTPLPENEQRYGEKSDIPVVRNRTGINNNINNNNFSDNERNNISAQNRKKLMECTGMFI